MARKGSGLTPKQQHFCRAVASGLTLSDAYRESYNVSKMSAAAIHNESSLLMAHHDVTVRVESLQRAKDRAVIASSLSDGEKVKTKLRELLDNPTGTPAEHVALRACDLLGKTVGLYKDVIETVVQRTPAEIQAEIKELWDRSVAALDKPDKAVH